LGDDRVEWFYQQDMVMFAAAGHQLLTKAFLRPQTFVHKELYEQVLHAYPSLGRMARGFPGAVSRSIRHHLGFLRGSRG
jgi:hypothetical protein